MHIPNAKYYPNLIVCHLLLFSPQTNLSTIQKFKRVKKLIQLLEAENNLNQINILLLEEASNKIFTITSKGRTLYS